MVLYGERSNKQLTHTVMIYDGKQTKNKHIFRQYKEKHKFFMFVRKMEKGGKVARTAMCGGTVCRMTCG